MGAPKVKKNEPLMAAQVGQGGVKWEAVWPRAEAQQGIPSDARSMTRPPLKKG